MWLLKLAQLVQLIVLLGLILKAAAVFWRWLRSRAPSPDRRSGEDLDGTPPPDGAEPAFFSGKLMQTGPDGAYPGNHRAFLRSVFLSADGMRVDTMLIDPASIEEIAADGPVLKVRYLRLSGDLEESYFLYSNFFDKTPKYTLQRAVEAATSAWAGRMGSAVR